ncbi:MAG: hypothetical protein V1883_04230 [Candidatus Omnitrophota bacterium]
MHFYLIGIDYKTTPFDARERIYRSRKAIAYFLENDERRTSAALITCNRIEIYGISKDPGEAINHIDGFFAEFPDFAARAYTKYGKEEVFRHALRLACGIESQIQGELQILAQVKAWSDRGIFHPGLKQLWDEAISISEELRFRAGLNDPSENIATIAFHDLKKRLNIKQSADIVVIGTGKIAELIAQYRQDFFCINFIAHKNHEKAEALARASGGRASLLIDLPRLLSGADAVISATSSPHYILKKEHFFALSKQRKSPLYLYDLAVPRDIEPAVRDIEGLVLRNLDDLSGAFDEHNRRKRKNIDLASCLVDEKLRNYAERTYGKSYQNRNAA